jgi:hypothetical protein
VPQQDSVNKVAANLKEYRFHPVYTILAYNPINHSTAETYKSSGIKPILFLGPIFLSISLSK